MDFNISAENDVYAGIIEKKESSNPLVIKADVSTRQGMTDKDGNNIKKIAGGLADGLTRVADNLVKVDESRRSVEASMRQGQQLGINEVDRSRKRGDWVKALAGESLEYRVVQQQALMNNMDALHIENVALVDKSANISTEDLIKKQQEMLPKYLENFEGDYETQKLIIDKFNKDSSELSRKHAKARAAYVALETQTVAKDFLGKQADRVAQDVEDAQGDPVRLQEIGKNLMDTINGSQDILALSKEARDAVLKDTVVNRLIDGKIGMYRAMKEFGGLDKFSTKNQKEVARAIVKYDVSTGKLLSTGKLRLKEALGTDGYDAKVIEYRAKLAARNSGTEAHRLMTAQFRAEQLGLFQATKNKTEAEVKAQKKSEFDLALDELKNPDAYGVKDKDVVKDEDVKVVKEVKFETRPNKATDFKTLNTGGYSKRAMAMYKQPKRLSAYEAAKPMMIEAAKRAGIDPGAIAEIANFESSFISTAAAFGGKRSDYSAFGYGQFINTTWVAMIGKYGKKYGINPKTPGKYRNDKKIQMAMLAEFTKENMALGKKNGGGDDAANIYAYHNLGGGKANQFFNELRKNPNKAVGKKYGGIMSNKVVSGNRSLYGDGTWTYAKVYKAMQGHMEKGRMFAADIRGNINKGKAQVKGFDEGREQENKERDVNTVGKMDAVEASGVQKEFDDNVKSNPNETVKDVISLDTIRSNPSVYGDGSKTFKTLNKENEQFTPKKVSFTDVKGVEKIAEKDNKRDGAIQRLKAIIDTQPTGTPEEKRVHTSNVIKARAALIDLEKKTASDTISDLQTRIKQRSELFDMNEIASKPDLFAGVIEELGDEINSATNEDIRLLLMEQMNRFKGEKKKHAAKRDEKGGFIEDVEKRSEIQQQEGSINRNADLAQNNLISDKATKKAANALTAVKNILGNDSGWEGDTPNIKEAIKQLYNPEVGLRYAKESFKNETIKNPVVTEFVGSMMEDLGSLWNLRKGTEGYGYMNKGAEDGFNTLVELNKHKGRMAANFKVTEMKDIDTFITAKRLGRLPNEIYKEINESKEAKEEYKLYTSNGSVMSNVDEALDLINSTGGHKRAGYSQNSFEFNDINKALEAIEYAEKHASGTNNIRKLAEQIMFRDSVSLNGRVLFNAKELDSIPVNVDGEEFEYSIQDVLNNSADFNDFALNTGAGGVFGVDQTDKKDFMFGRLPMKSVAWDKDNKMLLLQAEGNSASVRISYDMILGYAKETHAKTVAYKANQRLFNSTIGGYLPNERNARRWAKESSVVQGIKKIFK